MKRTKQSTPPAVTDDGARLTPVDGRSQIGGGIKLVPIEPPPFPSSRRRSRRKDKGAVPRKVFGTTDSRVLYTPTNVFPNRAVCKLILRYPLTPLTEGRGGTGTLIGPRHVLTAGHVLFNLAEGGYATRLRVVPGMDGNTSWFGSEVLDIKKGDDMVKRLRMPKEWTEDQDIDHDYGLITLKTGFPSLGSFGLFYPSD